MGDEQLKEELFHLRKKLSSVENLLTAAEQANTALENQNQQLQAQLEGKISENEALQQRNYSLGLKLSSTEQTLQCCTAELEMTQEQLDRQAAEMSSQLSNQHKKNKEALQKKTATWEQQCELAQAEVTQLKERLSLSQQQLSEAQEAFSRASNVSICGDDQDLQAQVASLMCDKLQLEQEVARVTASKDAAEQQLELAQQTMQQLNSQIEENQCKLTSYYNQVERLKDDKLSLEEEVNMYKLTEKDPKTKGNSLFAEVADQRHMMEQQYKKLRGHYDVIRNQYRLKARQVSQLKLQVASLLSLTGSRENSEYVTHLNYSLRIARSQILTLQNQITEMTRRIKIQQECPLVINCQPGGCATRSTFFQRTFEVNQKDLSNTKEQLREQRFNALLLGEKILEVQRRLNASEQCLAQSKAECIRLTVQLQDIQAEKGIFTEYDRYETRTELLPGHADYREPSATSSECGSDAKPDGTQPVKPNNSEDKEDKEAKTNAVISNVPASSTKSSTESSPKTSSAIASNSKLPLPASKSSLELTTSSFTPSSAVSESVEKKPSPSLSPVSSSTASQALGSSVSGCNGTVTATVSSGTSLDSAYGCTVAAQSSHSRNESNTKVTRKLEQDTFARKRVRTEDDVFEDASNDNKENTPVALPPCRVSTSSSRGTSKVKKSVRMQETVDVLCDGDEQFTRSTTKLHDGSGEKVRRAPRRMVPLPPKTTLPDMSGECKQQ